MKRSTFLWSMVAICTAPLVTWAQQNETEHPTSDVVQPVSCDSVGPCDESCACRAKPAAASPCTGSHKTLFYANNFGYLKEPDNSACCLGDGLKLLPIGECSQFGTVDFGGQLRLRYHHEKGMGQTPGLTRFQNDSNDFLLTRLRLYSNWQINECVRFFAEGIYAGADETNDYVPRRIDENYGDLLNLFVDVSVSDSTTLRVGRQELLYGAQRTVSPLDWANTRRTFEGVKVMHRQGDWAVDGFYTNLVPVDPTEFDEANYDLSFYGLYSVYSGFENATVDLYYLGFDNEAVATPALSDFSVHTLGVRVNGSCCDWLYELEGAPQFGRQSGLATDHMAGFATVGVGRKIKEMPWDTTVWFYYDYASGNDPGGDFNRFNQLFPLAHKYLGFVDATQRANIESPNVLVTMKPTKKTNLLLWYYHLMANQDDDIVPSIGATPAQSTGSKDWGDELDIILTYNICPRSKLLFGWSHFWAGNKIVSANKSDADFYYLEWTLDF